MTAATARSVLHVAFPAHGGVARVVADLVSAQLDAGWAVTVACPDGPLTRWLDPRARREPWQARRTPGPSALVEAHRLSRVISRVRPDIVHLHSSKAGLAGRLALRRRLPTVFQPHAWSFLATDGVMAVAARRWERLAARWADVIVHVSVAERRQGEQARIRPRQWMLVANGVDLDRFTVADRDAARRRLDLDGGPLVVCVGRICRQKGQDLLLAAWPRITANVPGAMLAVVGRLEEPLPVLPPGVFLRDETDDPRDWYAAADVIASPSRWEAGLPLVAREAMACGRSVVLSDLDVVRDDFPSTGGALVPVDDESGWVDAVVDRLRNPALATGEGEAAAHFAADHFGMDRTAAAMSGVYAALLGDNRR